MVNVLTEYILNFIYFVPYIETLVPARLAEFTTGIENSGGIGCCSSTHFAHDSGDLSRRISTAHHANYQVGWLNHFMNFYICNLIINLPIVTQTDPRGTEIDPGQRDAPWKLAHYRRENASRRSTSWNLSNAIRIFRVDHFTSSGIYTNTTCVFTYKGGGDSISCLEKKQICHRSALIDAV